MNRHLWGDLFGAVGLALLSILLSAMLLGMLIILVLELTELFAVIQ